MTILFLQTALFNMNSFPLVRQFQNLLFNDNHNEEVGRFSSLEVKRKKRKKKKKKEKNEKVYELTICLESTEGFLF